MVFERQVELGRVAFIAHGPDKGKLCTIVNVIDQNRALVDGPCTNVHRKDINFKALHLTQFTLRLGPGSRTRTVKKAWDKNQISEKWAQTTWAKKIENKNKKAAMTDFDRFKLMKAKQARNRMINIEYGKLRKTARKNPPKPKTKKLAKKAGKSAKPEKSQKSAKPEKSQKSKKQEKSEKKSKK
ncbi:60S ribosomal protein L14-like [Gigantopelta aegis]|uniref:60S ribosomal protein L14-like n=1 Tax=Gigantopelta aegis TaxID=1735272 RepID=UPI001B88BB6F|nr:60S ribosomal protein L14-like [Gigantopelta aegis]